MKNLTVTLMSIVFSLLLVRYYPYISKKLILEYITVACLASRLGKLINKNTADVIYTQENLI